MIELAKIWENIGKIEICFKKWYNIKIKTIFFRSKTEVY